MSTRENQRMVKLQMLHWSCISLISSRGFKGKRAGDEHSCQAQQYSPNFTPLWFIYKSPELSRILTEENSYYVRENHFGEFIDTV